MVSLARDNLLECILTGRVEDAVRAAAGVKPDALVSILLDLHARSFLDRNINRLEYVVSLCSTPICSRKLCAVAAVLAASTAHDAPAALVGAAPSKADVHNLVISTPCLQDCVHVSSGVSAAPMRVLYAVFSDYLHTGKLCTLIVALRYLVHYRFPKVERQKILTALWEGLARTLQGTNTADMQEFVKLLHDAFHLHTRRTKTRLPYLFFAFFCVACTKGISRVAVPCPVLAVTRAIGPCPTDRCRYLYAHVPQGAYHDMAITGNTACDACQMPPSRLWAHATVHGSKHINHQVLQEMTMCTVPVAEWDDYAHTRANNDACDQSSGPCVSGMNDIRF